MKVKKLTRYLIKIGIIFFVILILAAGGYFFAADQNQTTADDTLKLQGETSTVKKEFEDLNTKLSDSDKAKLYFTNYDQTENGNVNNFRRDYARKKLADIRDQDSLLDLSFSMEAFTKVTTPPYDKSNFVALFKSKITVQFTADTDIDAYYAIRDICQNFPGNVEIISYQINRLHEADEKSLVDIGSGTAGREALVSGEVVFEWQSIQNNLDAKTAPAGAPAGGPPGAPGAGAPPVLPPTAIKAGPGNE